MKNIAITAYERDGHCHIVTEGRIDTANAAEVEEKLFAVRKEYPDGHLIIHAQKLAYISSAGLRVLLRLQKEEKEKIRIINCSDDLFEIFSMTGFTELMNITKEIEKISTEGLDLIGKGASGTVYRLGPDQIVKMFTPAYKLSDIELERMAARTAFIKQIPTAIPFKTVKSGDSYGLVFELLNADTLTHMIVKNPEKMEEYVKRFVELGRQMHAQTLSSGEFISIKDFYRTSIESLDSYYSEEERERFLKVLDTIPDSNAMLHGDFHTANVMVDANDELVLIDMGGIGYGNPFFDTMGVALVYIWMTEKYPTVVEGYHGMPIEQVRKIWDCYMAALFPEATEEELSVYEKKVLGFTALRAAIYPVIAPTLPEIYYQKNAKLAVDTIKELFDFLITCDDWDKWNV